VNSLAGGRRLALAALAVIVLVPITVVVALHRTPAAPKPPHATMPASPPAATTPILSTRRAQHRRYRLTPRSA